MILLSPRYGPAVLPHGAGIARLVVSLTVCLVWHHYNMVGLRLYQNFLTNVFIPTEEKAPALVEKACKGNHGYRSCLVC